jgi:predicted metal-binding transcription factor (methanogenesis marker protein 9)
MILNCPACKAPIEVEVSTQPLVQNFEAFSQVILMHAGQTTCACGAVFIPAITPPMNINVGAVPVPPEQHKTLIVPAARLPPMRN